MMRFSYYYHVCIAVHFAGGQIPKPKAMTWLATERSQSRPSKTQETLALRRRHCRPCFLPFLWKALQGVLAAPAWSARCAEVFWGGKPVRRGHLSTSGSRGWPTSAWTGASTAHSWSRKCCVHFGTVMFRKPKCNCHAPPVQTRRSTLEAYLPLEATTIGCLCAGPPCIIRKPCRTPAQPAERRKRWCRMAMPAQWVATLCASSSGLRPQVSSHKYP